MIGWRHFDPRADVVGENMAATANEADILYPGEWWGHPYWHFALLATVCLLLLQLFLLWKPWRKWMRQTRADTSRGFWPSLSIAFWSTFSLCALSIWLDTVYHTGHGPDFYALVVFSVFPVVIVFLTFYLEGLETAYTELRDKERRQFEGAATAHVFEDIAAMDKKGEFFEAREWAIILLVVGGTLLVEQKNYYLPLVGVVAEEYHAQAHALLRIGLTIALTAFALVWVAQSPGKFVARENSAEFLGYSSRVPVGIVRMVWWILRIPGLQYPSEFVNELALEMMPRCKKKRNLAPSDLAFFADGLKKYGYGFLISDDTLHIGKDGEIEVISKTFHYVATPRVSVKRFFDFEKGFPTAVADELKRLDPNRTKCWAFDAPLIGERVDAASIQMWGNLFYAEDPAVEFNRAAATDYRNLRIYPTEGFRIDVSVRDKPAAPDAHPPTEESHEMEINLLFRENLPRTVEGKEPERAVLILWETRIMTNKGVFPFPLTNEAVKPYPYYKRHSHPCLRSTLIATLPDIKPSEDPYGGFVFVNADNTPSVEVTYDGVPHVQETRKFREQQRDPQFETPRAPKYTKDGGLRKRLMYYMDSSLPAANYQVKMHAERLRRVPEPIPPAPAATAPAPTGTATVDQVGPTLAASVPATQASAAPAAVTTTPAAAAPLEAPAPVETAPAAQTPAEVIPAAPPAPPAVDTGAVAEKLPAAAQVGAKPAAAAQGDAATAVHESH